MKKLLLGLAIILTMTFPALAGPVEFELQFPESVSNKSFSGRVFVLLTKGKPAVLTPNISWGRPEPVFAKDVKDWKPGEKLKIDSTAIYYPTPMDKLPKEDFYVQGVMDFEQGINFSAAPGNIYSVPMKIALGEDQTAPIKLTLDQVYKAPAFKETDNVKYIEIESKLLSEFHHKPTNLRAGVILPKSFTTNAKKQYPTIYEIPGFGGTHQGARGRAARNATDVDGVEMLYVMLDPSCPLGHHVFADSANNGPVGKAFTEELVPAIEKRFRGISAPGARFVTGHSSGGWSSLWLQVAYPDFFGGTWSTAPDPVDFRDFQRINIYEYDNMFTDTQGQARPLGRRGWIPFLYYKPFSDMEIIMGHGGQLASFEAVFSEKGSDGKPMQLWDRKTGKIDHAVAKTWEKYDIRLVLQRNWSTLEPKLKGKLHVYMGDRDTFYLEGATRLLGETLHVLGSDAKVELFPGKDHGTLMDRALVERIGKEMAEQYRKFDKKSAERSQ
ncbi:hypothetical protein KIH39_17365 [Telmatocola sphagniphila]|uniref:Esterase n=1 Tax=Telmatocola sphagniphila TaxID=1123043 RepID=A0A8E6B200_9BACT|nr:alpha/beta hydrolase-fold protein [Telmatocola sphagniphila]QVL30615.1 hypothetical protein KIH39_17365 [Telmatocola sphagniphila]